MNLLAALWAWCAVSAGERAREQGSDQSGNAGSAALSGSSEGVNVPLCVLIPAGC